MEPSLSLACQRGAWCFTAMSTGMVSVPESLPCHTAVTRCVDLNPSSHQGKKPVALSHELWAGRTHHVAFVSWPLLMPGEGWCFLMKSLKSSRAQWSDPSPQTGNLDDWVFLWCHRIKWEIGTSVSCLHEFSPVKAGMSASWSIAFVCTTLSNNADGLHHKYLAFFLNYSLMVALSTTNSSLVSS